MGSGMQRQECERMFDVVVCEWYQICDVVRECDDGVVLPSYEHE